MHFLAAALRENTALQKLDLSGKKISDAGVSKLTDAWGAPGPSQPVFVPLQ